MVKDRNSVANGRNAEELQDRKNMKIDKKLWTRNECFMTEDEGSWKNRRKRRRSEKEKDRKTEKEKELARW